MKKSGTGRGLRWRVLFSMLLSANWLSGQTAGETFAFADSQFEAGNYDLAVRTYQRCAFFGDPKMKTEATLRTAEAYFRSADYQKAERFFEVAGNLVTSDSLRTECKFRRSACFLIDQSPFRALEILLGMPEFGDRKRESRKQFYLGAAYFATESFEASEIAFAKCLEGEVEEQLHEIFKRKRRYKKPNPVMAKVLSTFIPGAGQMYSGDVKNSLNSFVLVAALGVATYEFAVVYGIIDAGIVVVPWLLRYYRGGRGKAAVIAENRRARKRSRVYAEIMELFTPGNLPGK